MSGDACAYGPHPDGTRTPPVRFVVRHGNARAVWREVCAYHLHQMIDGLTAGETITAQALKETT